MTDIAPVIATLAELVRIKSVNPAYEDGVSEKAVADYVRRFFEPYGLEMWNRKSFPTGRT